MVRAYLSDAKTAAVVDLRDEDNARLPMKKLDESGLFEVFIKGARKLFPYRIRTRRYNGEIRQFYDPYSFQATLGDYDLYLIGKGDDKKIYEKLGSHVREIDGIKGKKFEV